MKNFNKDILDKVLNNINEGLTDENFNYSYFNKYENKNEKCKKLIIENTTDGIFFFIFRCSDNIKLKFFRFYNNDFNKCYNNYDFFKYVIDYLYDIEEFKYNKDILENNFKQTRKTKTNII